MRLLAQGDGRELIERKARLQPDAVVQIFHIAGGNAEPLQCPAQRDAAVQWLQRHHAAYTIENAGPTRHGEHSGVAAQAAAEKPDGYFPRITAAADIVQRTDDIAGFTAPGGE